MLREQQRVFAFSHVLLEVSWDPGVFGGTVIVDLTILGVGGSVVGLSPADFLYCELWKINNILISLSLLWLKCVACEPQIMNSNPSGAFYLYLLNHFMEIIILYAYFFLPIWLLYFLLIMRKQVCFCWETISRSSEPP